MKRYRRNNSLPETIGIVLPHLPRSWRVGSQINKDVIPGYDMLVRNGGPVLVLNAIYQVPPSIYHTHTLSNESFHDPALGLHLFHELAEIVL